MTLFYSLLKLLINGILYLIETVLSLIQKIFTGFIRYIQTIRDIINKLYGVLVTNLFILLEVFNLGMSLILNMATIVAISIMTPLLALLLTNIILVIGYGILILLLTLAGPGGWFEIPKVISLSKLSISITAITLVLIILAVIAIIVLTNLQNIIHRKATLSSVGKMQHIPEPSDHRQ